MAEARDGRQIMAASRLRFGSIPSHSCATHATSEEASAEPYSFELHMLFSTRARSEKRGLLVR